MTLHTEWIQYGDDHTYSGYLARPERVNAGLPAVVVIQEIWGVDGHIENLVERFAQAGYVALAPDLYSRNGNRLPGLGTDEIDDVKQFMETMPPAGWHDQDARDQAMSQLPEPKQSRVKNTFTTLFGGLNYTAYTDYLLATTNVLRNDIEASKGQPVVSIGFCMGGALSGVLASADAQLAGAAIFYGQAPTDEQITQIQCPVRGYYGALDPRITDPVPAFAEKMKQQNRSFEYQVYDNAHHAFFNDTRASYHPAAARAAFADVIQFFDEVTRGN